jgi:hypothetical protein
VVLKWTTENEGMIQVFDIERSENGGRSYTKIGTVNSKNMSNTISNYALVDEQPINAVAYYRLVQKNKNGDISFTDIKVVDRSPIPASYFTIYPNPVHAVLNVNVMATASEKTTLEIFDMAGRIMVTQTVTLIAGEQNITVNMASLQKGSYILKFRLADKTTTQMVNKF